MTFFGLTDPWIIAGYVLCFVCVAFCCTYAYFKGVKGEEGEDE